MNQICCQNVQFILYLKKYLRLVSNPWPRQVQQQPSDWINADGNAVFSLDSVWWTVSDFTHWRVIRNWKIDVWGKWAEASQSKTVWDRWSSLESEGALHLPTHHTKNADAGTMWRPPRRESVKLISTIVNDSYCLWKIITDDKSWCVVCYYKI
jgi:hypothetical protein